VPFAAGHSDSAIATNLSLSVSVSSVDSVTIRNVLAGPPFHTLMQPEYQVGILAKYKFGS
jgi:hypothetical protein